MALVHQNSAKIDHFSSLPNELLQDIFDLAYRSCSRWLPRPLALSSRLHPFLENAIYSDIALADHHLAPRLLLLSQALSSRRQLGEKVMMVRFVDWDGEDDYKLAVETARNVRSLLRLTPNLRYFAYDTSLPYIPFIPSGYSSLRHLTHITLSTPFIIDSRLLDLDELEWLTALPALTSLKLTEWWREMQCSSSHDLLLPQIKHLAIEGEGAAEPVVANLVNACSALVQLKLDASFTFDFGLTLPLFQSTIESLCLCASTEELELDGSDTRIDNHLSHFTNLTTLELPYGVISSGTPSALLCLPNLVNLVLGNSEVEVSALLPLIEGQDRLPHLKRITLNDEYFDLQHFDPTNEYSKKPFQERNDFPLLRWTQFPYSDPSQRWRDLINLELAGRRNGVMIEGVGGAEHGLREYVLEKHNLAIAQAYYHFDFSYVHEART
ncbi:hypothetical protein JCM5353_005854 [Sporobolomyces roseus]